MSSPKLPELTQARILRALAKLDVHPVRKGAGKGSHCYVVGPDGRRSNVMAHKHARSEVATVLKQLGISHEDFLNAL
ncbi:MAG: hypothetical protein WD794_05200 [Mycobacteriales bacterium]